tara:strand:- start:26 stop:325 length:300 start_codon:yes stop_codon:yes gene_type:complete
MYKCFGLSIENNIAHLQMNRPEKCNSMMLEFWTEPQEIVADIDTGSKARVIVLSFNGSHFTAGLDEPLFAFVGKETAKPTKTCKKFSLALLFFQNVTEL